MHGLNYPWIHVSKTNSNKGKFKSKRHVETLFFVTFFGMAKWPSKDKWPPTITDKKVTNWITWAVVFCLTTELSVATAGDVWKLPPPWGFFGWSVKFYKKYMFNILVHLFHSKCLIFVVCHFVPYCFFSVRILNSVLILDCQLLSVLHNLSVFAWENFGGFQPKIT